MGLQTFKCCSCGATQEIESNGYMADTIKVGWWPVLLRTGGAIYLCPSCASRVAGIVTALVEKIGTDDIHIPGLVRMAKEIDNATGL